ncbi:MAG: Glu/Leu/Phe/Val dehydrogenase dimerization domain-containing protein [Acidimicrobiia bacterium]
MEITKIRVPTHEQVMRIVDRDLGIDTIIAIHSTALGPALGGIRFWHYDSDDAMLADALALSKAMSLKASAAGLFQGGGKAVTRWAAGAGPRSAEQLAVIGNAIDALGGRYLAAEDVGATTADMDGIAAVTPWVTGVSESEGGSGDPSPVTAFGVWAAMRAAANERWGSTTLTDRHVVIQGAGKVGSSLARSLHADGARVSVSDVDDARVAALVKELKVQVLAPDAVITAECDVLAPCAMGGAIDADHVAQLRCEIVCGGANNQLASIEMDDALAQRGILYAPDFIVNAGGILNIAEEFVGYSRDNAISAAARIEGTTARVFEMAREWGCAPGHAAIRIAEERIESHPFGTGRWEPGDPTAWTHGSPFVRVRPNR